jgi:ATP-dependent DNA ligase
LFNILFLNGEDYTTRPYRYILKLLKEAADRDVTNTIRAPEEVKFNSYSDAIKWAENNINDVEGLVLWKMDENAEITYNGKPSRRACYKLKAVKETDVIAYDYLEGSGAKQGKVGSLLIGKYNKELTEIVPMGRVGSGLKIKQGECEIDYWDFPCVIEINYDQRFETGNFQFPRFSKIHESKLPIEVVVDDDGF